MGGSWHRWHPEMPAVQLFFKHVWCPVTGCQRSSWKLELKWAGPELKWRAANYKMHLILGRLLLVHVLCGREILEDRADWHLKHGEWLWGAEMNDKRHTRIMGRLWSHCRLIPFIWFWHGYAGLFFSGTNCFTSASVSARTKHACMLIYCSCCFGSAPGRQRAAASTHTVCADSLGAGRGTDSHQPLRNPQEAFYAPPGTPQALSRGVQTDDLQSS